MKDMREVSSHRLFTYLQTEAPLILVGFSTYSEELKQLVWLECELLVGLLENFLLASWLTNSFFYLSYWLFWLESYLCG